METNPSSSKTDRKTVERNRRNQMKALYSELGSHLPHQSTKEVMSLPDQLYEAANYIKKLQIKLEKMTDKKAKLMGVQRLNIRGSAGKEMEFQVPVLEIHEIGSAIEVVLITGLDNQLMFKETLRVLHEEGAEVVNASYYTLDDRVFHSIHTKVEDSALVSAASKISMRLKAFFNQANAM